MLKQWFKAYFGNVDFKVSHVEHFSYADLLRYTGQRFYNRRMHDAFYHAVKESFDNDCRYYGMPYGDYILGEPRRALADFYNSFIRWNSFTRKGNPSAMMARLNYLREYPESEKGFILADKFLTLVWLQPGDWIEYINQYSPATVQVYIDRLFRTISSKILEDTQFYKLHLEVMELFEIEKSNPLFPQMLHAAFSPGKEFNFEDLKNAKG